MTDSILSLRGVNVNLKSDSGAVHVLKNVTLDLPKGKTVAVTGPSGSGKTTLLMVMAGLERPTSGEIVAAGRPLHALSEDALADFRRDALGIVFQNFHLIPTMTALENVAVPLDFAGRPDAARQAAEALDRVGLAARARHYPAQLSGGEQQRVAIARACAPQPPLILADEPTGNLDAATGEKVMDLLFSLARDKGATLVLVTHDAALAARCDIVLRVRDGEVAA